MRFFSESPVYLVDMHCYKPPEELKMDTDKAIDIWRKNKTYEESVIDFNQKITSRSGLSTTHTHLMKYLNPEYCGNNYRKGINESMEEMQMVLFGAVEGLLQQTKIKPTDIDILISCCSIFCPTPSMTAAIINKFHMRSDVQSYHLGGMGCAMGVVSVNLIRDLLKAHPNSIAMLCTTEITTPAFYTGTERSRLVTNLLFRMGGAAMLFTNRVTPKLQPKYELKTAIRVHQGNEDAAYKCINYSPDSEGINGVFLGRDVVTEAGRGLEKVMIKFAPHVLGFGQMAWFGLTELGRRFNRKIKRYSPSFENRLDHVVIHAGGAKVLEGLGQNLKLSDYTLKPSYDVLYYYGNVSSSTTWYTLSNIETLRGVRKGDKIMQVGVGSGLKCGVNLWVACRDIWEMHNSWKHVAEERGITPKSPKLPMLHEQSWMSALVKIVFLVLLLFTFVAILSQSENKLVASILQNGLVDTTEL